MDRDKFINYLKTLPKDTKIFIVRHHETGWASYREYVPLEVIEDVEMVNNNKLCIGN